MIAGRRVWCLWSTVRRAGAVAGFALVLTVALGALAPGEAAACRGSGESCGLFHPCCSGYSCGPAGDTHCYPVPRQLGQPCSTFNKCADGLCCGWNSKCKEAGTSGEPCADCPDNRCTDGTTCGPITESPQMCYHEPRELGEPCQTSACADGLSCGPIGDQVCYHSPRHKGEPCSSTACDAGLCCGENLTCEEEAGSGEPCACPLRLDDGGCLDGLSCGPITESPRLCYHEPRELGEPCSSTACADGLSCGPLTNQICFHNPRHAGEPCSSTPCAAGLCCGGDLTCKQESGLGEECACPGDLVGDGGCGDGASCGPIFESPRICYSSPRVLGEPCSDFNPCGPNLSCGPIGDQVCYHSPRQLDEPCSVSNPCEDGLFCNAGLRCEERADLGESCSELKPCLEDLSCGPLTDRHCYNVPREYGDPCSIANPCGPGLSCQPGVQKCYTVPRQLEEPCSLGFECDAGLSCQPGVQKCYHEVRELGEPCSLGFECGPGLSCQPGVQKCYHVPRQFEEPCSAGFECDAGLSCQPGVQQCYHVPRRYEEPCSLGFECGECLSCQPGVQRCYNHPRTAGEPCSVGFPCGQEGFECNPLLLRCTPPDGMQSDDEELCAALYSDDISQTAMNGDITMGFSLGEAAAAGVGGSFEAGVVYGDEGQYGCFTAECVGGESDLTASAFFTVAIVDAWDNFPGQSVVTSIGVSTPVLELGGFAAATIFSSDLQMLIGEAQSISIGVGVSPVDVGVATCFTQVFEVDLDRWPPPEPNCACTDIEVDDTDGDGYNDCVDGCPDDPDMSGPTDCRDCGEPAVDTDGDGVEDCVDECPDDELKFEAGECGCGTAETDTDDDGTPDCVDECPENGATAVAGDCGCEPAATDRDGDGVIDCDDGCPDDPGKIEPGICGCGIPDLDANGDDVVDPCGDACPDDDTKTAAGVCGCGQVDPAPDAFTPQITCTDGQAECGGAATPVTTGATAIDKCGLDLKPTTNAPARFPLGSTAVAWTATDQDGYAASCQASATVVDTSAPAVSCRETSRECAGALTPVPVRASATDACDGDLTPTPDDAGPYPLGRTQVTVSATDSSGNTGTCTTNAVVVDRTDPTVTCAGATRECLGPLTPVPTTCVGADTCDPDVTLVSTALERYPLGQYPFACFAIDDSGNGAAAQCQVVIEDTLPPTAACTGDTQECAGALTPVTTTCSGTDACDAEVATETTAAEAYPLGASTFECTAEDDAGHLDAASCDVRIVDTTAPAVTCAGETVECTGDASATGTVTGAATDICWDTVTVAGTGTSVYGVGTHVVSVTGTDGSGNVGICDATVVVQDTVPPTIAATPGDDVYECGEPYIEYGATASDVCYGDLTAAIVTDAGAVDTAVPTSSQADPTDTPYVVTYDVADGAGNGATATRDVTVLRYFAADEGILWVDPVPRGTSEPYDTDPSGLTTPDPSDDVRFPFVVNRTIPVKVRVVDKTGADVTDDPSVSATVAVYHVADCDVTEEDGAVDIDSSGIGGGPGGEMEVVYDDDGTPLLRYNLSTAGWPGTGGDCYLLAVTAGVSGACNDGQTEYVILQRRR